MPGPNGFENRMRLAMAVTLVAVVIVAPLVGVYAFSPFLFAYGVGPYQLAVSVAIMIAEALAVGALFFLVLRARR